MAKEMKFSSGESPELPSFPIIFLLLPIPIPFNERGYFYTLFRFYWKKSFFAFVYRMNLLHFTVPGFDEVESEKEKNKTMIVGNDLMELNLH